MRLLANATVTAAILIALPVLCFLAALYTALLCLSSALKLWME